MKELRKIFVFFVDNDKEKDRILGEMLAKDDILSMIILSLPWGWEILASAEIYEYPELEKDFRKALNDLPGNEEWFTVPNLIQEKFILVKDVAEVTKEQISQVYTSLGRDWKETDLRESVCPEPKIKKPKKIPPVKTPVPPQKKGKEEEKPDWKKLAAGDTD